MVQPLVRLAPLIQIANRLLLSWKSVHPLTAQPSLLCVVLSKTETSISSGSRKMHTKQNRKLFKVQNQPRSQVMKLMKKKTVVTRS